MAKHQNRHEDFAARSRPAARRPFRPVAVGFVLAGLAGWIALRSEVFRRKLINQVQGIVGSISGNRSGSHGGRDDSRRHPVAFTAAETMPIAAPTYLSKSPTGSTGYPPGFGSDAVDPGVASEGGAED